VQFSAYAADAPGAESTMPSSPAQSTLPLSPVGYCNVAAAPLRAAGSHRAEMTSQLLFGERADVLEETKEGWMRVRCHHDGYDGWIRSGQLSLLTAAASRRPARCVVVGDGARAEDAETGGAMPMPAGAVLEGLKSGILSLPGGAQARFRGSKELRTALRYSPEALRAHAMRYLHAPYLWGGRTVWGIDCSGLVQMAFALCGVALPRDAWQQAEAGTEVDFLAHARSGDVAFFDNDAGRIVHTGILLGDGQILHATETSGRAVIDRIDTEGIVSVSLKRRTHRLRAIRRYAE